LSLKPLNLAFGALVATVFLPLAEKLSLPEPYQGFVSAASHHLIIDSQILMVAGFLLHIIFGSVEHHVKPMVEGSFKTSQHVLEHGFKGMEAVFARGFKEIEDVLAVRVGAIPSALKEAFERALGDIAKTFITPGVKELVKGGKIDEAVAKIGREEKKDDIKRKEEIAALLHSEDHQKWDTAASILDEFPDSREAKFYLTLAYRYWNAGQLNRAIEVAEKGLEFASKVEESLLPKFQNSLAYYYADANRTDRETNARKYAAESLDSRKEDCHSLDTQGYVLISFGTTKEEIEKGVDLCHDAMRKGAPFEFYIKHIKKAHARLKNL
jgi:hypothetical protein